MFDFDHYYLGGVIAEHLAISGKQVTYATPAGHASAWTFMTNELPFVYQALAREGVAIHTTTNLISFEGTHATVANSIQSEHPRIGGRWRRDCGSSRP